MKQTLFSLAREFIKVIVIVAIAVPFISLFAAWSEPSAAPTLGNAAAPINVGTIFQTKNGGVELKGGLVASSIIDKGALLLSPFAPNFLDPEVQTAMSQDGVIYYDLTAQKFKCYENGTWKDCVGTGAGGGAGISGYEINKVQGGNGGLSIAYCSGEKKVLGGGCADHTPPYDIGGVIVANRPQSNNGWYCNQGSGIVEAYAICADVQ